MKIAIITPVWPSNNEMAILNTIVELKKQGIKDLHFFAFGTNIKTHKLIPKEFIEYKLYKNITYLSQPDLSIKLNKLITKLILIIKSLPYLIRTFFYSPNVLYKALFKKEYGEYRKAFKIIYLIQALLGNSYCFDYIHCHYAPNGIWGAILKDLGFFKGKLITTFHGYGINKLPKEKPSDYYSFLISKSTFFTSNSNFTKKNAVKIGFPTDKIHIIRVALNSKLYNSHKRTFNNSQTFQIITVAALRNVKGLEYSIKAMKIILEQCPDIKIIYKIAGEGYLKEKLQKLIKELNIENYVILLGFVLHDDLKNIYDDSHLFILPSVITNTGNQEAQGLVIQEAQACGIPVIGTNTGGIPEGILSGKSGFIVNQKKPKEIAEKILYFYDNPQKISVFGKNGRIFIEDNFNINIETQKLINLYKTY